MESEKEEEDSEGEMESSTARPETQAVGGGPAAGSAAPALTKAQAKELRRVKKLDHSWLAGLLES